MRSVQPRPFVLLICVSCLDRISVLMCVAPTNYNQNEQLEKKFV